MNVVCLLLAGFATHCEVRESNPLVAEARRNAGHLRAGAGAQGARLPPKPTHTIRREAVPEAAPVLSEPPMRSGELGLTPLRPELAARALALAWQARMGKRLLPRGLAILIAHWALETGRGERMFAHNFGGLKGSADNGALTLWTREREGGGFALVQQPFRVYRSAEAGADDYVRLLDDRYPRAVRAVRDGAVAEFVRALARDGYFTDDPGAYERAMRSLWYEYLQSGVASVSENLSR